MPMGKTWHRYNQYFIEILVKDTAYVGWNAQLFCDNDLLT